MRIMKCFSTLAFALLLTNAHAAIFYRHIPFTLTINADDSIIVDYDFSEKKGIHCVADYHAIQIKEVAYKGHQDKSAWLPITLQSDHIPDSNKTDEILADVTGKFTLVMNASSSNASPHEVSCYYVKRR